MNTDLSVPQGLLTTRTAHQRIVVACSTTSVAQKVYEALKNEGKIKARLVTTEFSQSGIENCKFKN